MSNWEYKGIYKKYNMENIINLPFNSKVQVYDWLMSMPDFMMRADTIFVDPPWNIGNTNTFYHKADKEHIEIDFIKFSKILFQRFEEINPEFLFIEIGKEFLSWYIEECKKRYKYTTFYNSTYYHNKKNKCYIIHATNLFKKRRYKELEDLDEEDIIKWICKNHEYSCIGDLCMGMGLVGKHAYLNNKQFVGIELNKKRLAILIDFITKKENAKTKK
ncbi:MAG: hypothetical protein ACTSUI_02180 [Promethearchaeota archaeon]